MNNPRIIHILCGASLSGKTMFSRYLQAGKKNVFRLSVEELIYSIGLTDNDPKVYHDLIRFMTMRGDVVVDSQNNNIPNERRRIVLALRRLSIPYKVYGYIIKRPEIDSEYIKWPDLVEGFNKIMAVSWEDSVSPMTYGEDVLSVKPKIITIKEDKIDQPIIRVQKKKTVKDKLHRGRANLFRPSK
jgi:hypothetical protein